MGINCRGQFDKFSRLLPGGTEGNHEESRCSGLDMNSGHTEYKAGALSRLRELVRCCVSCYEPRTLWNWTRGCQSMKDGGLQSFMDCG